MPNERKLRYGLKADRKHHRSLIVRQAKAAHYFSGIEIERVGVDIESPLVFASVSGNPIGHFHSGELSGKTSRRVPVAYALRKVGVAAVIVSHGEDLVFLIASDRSREQVQAEE